MIRRFYNHLLGAWYFSPDGVDWYCENDRWFSPDGINWYSEE